jgi:hypothetical protein
MVPPGGNRAAKWEEMTNQQVQIFANQLFFWAGKWGLLGHAAAEHVRPFEHLINAALGLTFRPLITDRETHNYFSILRFFPQNLQQGATIRSRNTRSDEMGRKYDLFNNVGSLAYAQSSLITELFVCIGRAVERQMNKEIFTSLSMTPPREW